jgi:hypothetical protein
MMFAPTIWISHNVPGFQVRTNNSTIIKERPPEIAPATARAENRQARGGGSGNSIGFFKLAQETDEMAETCEPFVSSGI